MKTRSRKGVHRHGTIHVTLCRHTEKLVKGWQKAGANVSDMVRYAVLKTYPVALRPEEQAAYLKELKAKEGIAFEDYRKAFERRIGVINRKLRQLSDDEKANAEEEERCLRN